MATRKRWVLPGGALLAVALLGGGLGFLLARDDDAGGGTRTGSAPGAGAAAADDDGDGDDWVNVSGMLGDTPCVVIDMDGRELGRLPGAGCDFFPDGKAVAAVGDDLTIFDASGEVFLRKPLPVHHALSVVEGDEVLLLSYETHVVGGREWEWDVILLLSKEGEELFRWSAWEHLEEIHAMLAARCAGEQRDGQFCRWLRGPMKQPFGSREALTAAIVADTRARLGDVDEEEISVVHLNTAKLLPANPHYPTHPAFRPGNILTCCWVNGFVAVIDRQTGALVWSHMLEESYAGQHTPELLPDGNMVMFVNERRLEKTLETFSALVELDPIGGKVVWEYRAARLPSFYMGEQGSVQRLANGNTLATNWNEAFEVNREGEVVWQILYPRRRDAASRARHGVDTSFLQIRRAPRATLAPYLGDGE